MKIAITWNPERVALSFRTYTINLIQELSRFGIQFISFSSHKGCSDDVDIYWTLSPTWKFRKVSVPQVVSMLGDYGLGIPLKDFYGNSPQDVFRGTLHRWRLTLKLRVKFSLISNIAAVIVPSDYARGTIVKHLGLDDRKVVRIYHGIDHSVFRPEGPRAEGKYLLHVSQWTQNFHHQKNLVRILKAWLRSNLAKSGITLLLIIPNYPFKIKMEGVKLLAQLKEPRELAKFYRGAIGMIFPSLKETFGFPILEAMACGCPVITSNTTACNEVAGDAALKVNPHSVTEIANAMEKLVTSSSLRDKLRDRGLKRAKEFTWEKCAYEHFRLFKDVIKVKRR